MPDNDQDKKLQHFTRALLLLTVTVLIFAAGYRLGEYKARKALPTANAETTKESIAPARRPKDMELFWTVWALVEQKYADQQKVKPKQMLYGAIKGLVASLEDPYSFFLTPEENQQSKDDLGGKYEGIGAELGMKDGRIIVVTPLDNSPAKAAGVKPGDVILAVDGQLTRGWTTIQAVNKIRGEGGTTVKLTLLRQNKQLEIKIKRQQIKIKSVELSYLTAKDCRQNCGKVARIKVTTFGDNTDAEWDKAVSTVAEKWQHQEIKGLIVDVRGNPGGYLEGAVYLASEFLPLNTLVIKQEYADKTAKEYRVQRQGKLLNLPLVVLIDEGSASASEIFSGSLRDYSRAKLIGQKSFGKGSVQEALDLSGNTGLHLTIAKWVLPKGDWINSKGIEPDQTVEIKTNGDDTVNDATDTQLQAAITSLTQ